jgi:hypothetical protein
MPINKVLDEGAFTNASRKTVNDNFRDISQCTTAFSLATSTTLTNVVGMATSTLQPGDYEVEINLIMTSGASGGVKMGLKWGTASMITATAFTVTGRTASVQAVTTFTTSTDAASVIAATTAYINVQVVGRITVAVAGTIQLQVAQNASDATATTVGLGSTMSFTPIGATVPASGTLGI